MAKPALLTAPLIASAPIVTATSSQYDIRVNNGLAAYVASPYTAQYVSAPYASAPYVSAPYVSAPYASAAYLNAPYIY